MKVKRSLMDTYFTHNYKNTIAINIRKHFLLIHITFILYYLKKIIFLGKMVPFNLYLLNFSNIKYFIRKVKKAKFV